MRDFVIVMGWLVVTYGFAGLIAAAFAQGKWLRRIDPAIEGAGVVFRVLITPGLIALWPLVLGKYLEFRRGAALLGDQESPVTQRRLRRLHIGAWKLMVIAGPLILAVALGFRPRPVIEPATKAALGLPGNSPEGSESTPR